MGSRKEIFGNLRGRQIPVIHRRIWIAVRVGIHLACGPVNLPLTPRVTAALLAGVSFLSLTQQAFARVGETREAIERRLVQPNLGKIFFKPKDSAPSTGNRDKDKERAERDAERDRAREEKDQPFSDAKKFFPAGTTEVVYWKSAVGGQLSLDNGWKIHVFYAGGTSAVEAYRRVGDAINEFEIRALLHANRGASSWKKVSSDGGGTNGIGYDYELEDGSMRAKLQGNWLMVFSTRVDNYVIEQQKLAKADHDKDQDKQKKEQQGKVGESVNGF